MDRTKFFALIRSKLAGGSLTQSQVDGFGRILDEWERRKLTDLRHLAYMLATVWHETAAKMQPIPEMGGPAYLKSKPYYPWYGRGLVQCTWDYNYAKFGVTNPDDMLQWPASLKALFDGMALGVFTGKRLGDYFSATANDAIAARRIINGNDRAGLVAGYHLDFLTALQAAVVPANPPPSMYPGSVFPRFPIDLPPRAPPVPAPLPDAHIDVIRSSTATDRKWWQFWKA